jgi:transcriptional regulator with PAS, ATPase and Fis domain
LRAATSPSRTAATSTSSRSHVVGRTAEEWGERIEPHLPFYRREGCEEVLRQVTDALKRTERALRARQRALARATGTDEGDPSGIVAKSEGMRQVLDLARRVAKVDSTVLLTGESGVGKERLARLIHDESARAAGPFVAVNCGAVAENLLESELFGHVRGSFTGATQDRPGLFEAAGRGTLFLDEVGEVPPAMQVKLLRVLEAREVRRVGENKSRPIDVRLVAATNRDLSKEVAAGRFREDLYYRLRVVELRIAPLRDRKEDVLPLAHALLAETSRRLGRRMTGFAPEAAGQLVRYGWPGNVRELRNAIERAVALARGSRVELLDLPDEVRGAQAVSLVPGEGRALEDVEREFILASLEANGGSQVKTAGQLKIGIATLRRKLKRYRERGQAVRDAARRAPRSK